MLPKPLPQRIQHGEFRNLSIKFVSAKKDANAHELYMNAEKEKTLAFKEALETEFFPKDEVRNIIPKPVFEEMFMRAISVGGASQLEAMEAYKDFAAIVVLMLPS